MNLVWNVRDTGTNLNMSQFFEYLRIGFVNVGALIIRSGVVVKAHISDDVWKSSRCR